MGSMRFERGALMGALLIAACGGPVTSPDAGTGEDAGGGGCPSACDDRVFCNGAERCENGSCVSGAARCATSMVCDEENARCVDPMGCADDDGDGHTATTCGGDDCDDTDAARFPGNSETCDARGHDEDCDPSTLGGSDEDGDGHESVACCNAQPDGALVCGDDCDDDRGSVHPGVTDDCNLTDDDCDGVLDEDPATIFYRDLDGDGFGRPGDPDDTTVPEGERAVRACGGGPGFSPFDTDCDDAVRMINPAAPEVCADGVDNNCDAIQDADPARPGFACACTTLGEERACGGGASNVPPAICRDGVQSCQVGGTWSACIGDVAPQTERCNDVDDDCDGTVDEAVQITCYADPDNDGFAEAGATSRSLCAIPGRESVGGCPILFTNLEPIDASTSDCAGSDASVRPGALDRCNLLDDDCDGAFDEGADDAGCTNTTAWGVCETGQCTLLACRYSRGDCDRVASNGCETDLETSAAHCGGCGNFCPLGATCRQGLCVDGFTQISAGGQGGTASACAIDATGQVWCWGRNSNGQLGNGSTSSTGVFPPGPIAASFEATEVDVGALHTCAVSAAKEAWCWGYNSLGSVGLPTSGPVPTPTRVAGVSEVEQVGTGQDFSCARTSSGELWCWGADGNGQLGNGAAGGGSTPSRVPLSGSVVDFSLGLYVGCAVLDTGEVWCWGYETYGELGNGPAGSTTSPVRIAGFDAVDVEVSGDQACAIRSTGELWCWGRNEAGRPLGLSTYGHRNAPVHIPGVSDAVAVSMDYTVRCALQSDGALLCWSATAALAEGASPTPRVITSLGVATQVTTGGEELVYVLDDVGTIQHRDGRVSSPYGAVGVRLGTSSTDVPVVRTGDGYLSPPMRSPRGVMQMAVQNRHYCAVLTSGEVVCGGGLSITPTLVSGITDAWQVERGESFTCVLHQSGAVSCWGANGERQLGVPTPPFSSTAPIAVPGVTDAVELATGATHACVRRSDGRVMCWGANDRGQLGTGSTASSAAPSLIGTLERVVGISAGGDHTCATLSSGELRCWGENNAAQLGNTTVAFSPTPLSVAAVTGPRALGAGSQHQCALDAAGRALCWGRNLDWQLGAPSPSTSADPILAPGIFGARQIDGGQSQTCALQGTQVICWGNDAAPAPIAF